VDTDRDADADTDADSDSDADTDSDSDADSDADSDSDADTDTPPTGETGTVTETGDTATPPTETGDTGGVIIVDPNDVDDDGDALTENQGDCNDDPSADGVTIYPGALEVLDDGVDQDCDGYDAHPEVCGGAFSKVYGTFIGPDGSTVTSISGERIPDVGVDDQILWQAWTTGSPAGMIVTISGNRVDFILDSCVDDAAAWRVNVDYLDAGGAAHLDCESAALTGTWTVQFDNAVQTVTPDVWDVANGDCYAYW
jgi:hypothetical protein